MFADDLFVFCKATDVTAVNFKHFHDNFKIFSGLGVNWGKSVVFFSNCVTHDQVIILDILNVQKGSFPMKYLGIPLSPKKLSFKDYQPLLGKIQQRLAGWKSKACPMQEE